MYILLCGYPPFNGGSDKEIFNAIIKGEFTFPAEEWNCVSQDAKTLVKKLLTYDMNKRITAKEALEDKWIRDMSAEKHKNT